MGRGAPRSPSRPPSPAPTPSPPLPLLRGHWLAAPGPSEPSAGALQSGRRRARRPAPRLHRLLRDAGPSFFFFFSSSFSLPRYS